MIHSSLLRLAGVRATAIHKNAHSIGGKPIECGRSLFVPQEVGFVKLSVIDETRTFD